jgi:hypothetical protein
MEYMGKYWFRVGNNEIEMVGAVAVKREIRVTPNLYSFPLKLES